jgi:hypothetical protein
MSLNSVNQIYLRIADGSGKGNKAGSASIIYQQNKIIHEIVSPIGDLSISYAELFAIYSFRVCLGLRTRQQSSQRAHGQSAQIFNHH